MRRNNVTEQSTAKIGALWSNILAIGFKIVAWVTLLLCRINRDWFNNSTASNGNIFKVSHCT